jgi:transposase
MLSDGETYTVIQQALRCNRSYVSRWKQRFESDGLSALYSRHPGRAPAKNATKVEAKILAKTQRKPSDGSTHWEHTQVGSRIGNRSHESGAGMAARATATTSD